jgi:tetratricopeptide (TPR) repeat protein
LLARCAGEQRVAAEPGDAARIAELCGRLPIAVTLAAQRLRSRPRWGVRDLAGKLEAETRRLDELHGRHRAVRAVFDLSFRTLPDGQRGVFRLLGLHPAADFTADSVAALVDTSPGEAGDTLDALLDEHLIEEVVPGRYRLHDLVRLYARERAIDDVDAGAREAALGRLFGWYLHTAETAAGLLDPGHRPVPLDSRPPHPRHFETRDDALAWCAAERAALLDVVRTAAAGGADVIAWQLPCSLLTFYYLRKHWDDWISTHQLAVRAAVRTGDRAAQARVLNGLGVAYSDVDRLDEAVTCHVEAQPLFGEVGDLRGQAWNLNNLGVAFHKLRRFDDAAGCHRGALPLFRAMGDPHGESIVLCNLGDAHRLLGRLEPAGRNLREALEIQQRTGDRAAQRYTFLCSGDLHRDRGSIIEAIADYRRALAINRDLDDRRNIATVLTRLADVLDVTGQATDAVRCWREAYATLSELDDPEAELIRARLDEDADSSAR